MFTKKSLVMLGIKNEEEKAVLSLEKNGDIYDGRVRLYNFLQEPTGILSIGFYNNTKVVKAGLSRSSNMLYTFKLDSKEVCDDFSCAVINISQGEMDAILYGNTAGAENKVSQLGKIMTTTFSQPLTLEETEKALDENQINYSDEYQDEIDNEIDKNLCGDCNNCKYKQAFFDKDKTVCNETISKNGEQKTFFMEIKGQVDSLFDNNAKEDYLEEIIPNSKWVKVDFGESGDYYVLGLIFEAEDLKFIVYGVPGVFQKNPPKELAGYPVWFPLDKNKPESFGYWLSYQDAKTGDSIKALVE